MPANEARPGLQAPERMLQVTMADRSGSNHQRAIGNRFGNGFEFFGLGQHIRGADGGASILKGHFVGIHHPQMKKSKIAHCPGGRANVQGIARVYQDNAQMIEFSGNGQARNILRHPLQQKRSQLDPLSDADSGASLLP